MRTVPIGPLLQPVAVETPPGAEKAFPLEMELADVGQALRIDAETLCPTSDHPAYTSIAQPQGRNANIINSTKAIYDDPNREHMRIGKKYAVPVTRAWLARFPEEDDLIYLVVDSVYILPMQAVSANRRPVARDKVVHARFFPDGRYEFNPALYGENQTVEQREVIMGHVVDTVIEIGEQHRLEVTRRAAYRSRT